MADASDSFIRELTSCQNRLYAYILTLLPDAEQARDVLQETNLVLWRKSSEFREDTNFGAWACKVAYFEVLSHRQKQRRDRHLFDDQLLEQLALGAESRLANLDERSHALDECLQHLTPQQRERLMARYTLGGSVQAIAASCGESVGAVATALFRIRSSLLDCINSKLARRSSV